MNLQYISITITWLSAEYSACFTHSTVERFLSSVNSKMDV